MCLFSERCILDQKVKTRVKGTKGKYFENDLGSYLVFYFGLFEVKKG